MKLWQLKESVNDKAIFKAIFLAGIPGAGKSKVVQTINNPHFGARVVDPDRHVEFISDKYGLDPSNQDTWMLTKHARVTELVNFVNGMLPMFVAGTGASSYNTLRRDEILTSFGYDTAMIWVGSDIDTVITNMQMRRRQVPLDVLHANFESLMDHFKTYQEHFGKNFFMHENVFLTPDENKELQELRERDRTSLVTGVDAERMHMLGQKAQSAVQSEANLTDIIHMSDNFFSEPIKNAKGQSTVAYLERIGGKYLTDGVVSLDNLLTILGKW